MTTDGSIVADLAADLRAEAERSDERRVLVLAGARDAGIDAAFDAVAGAEIPDDATTIVSTREGFRFDRVAPRSASSLLGSTREAVILDCHDYFAPNALGRVVGAVDGGGLLVLLTPPLAEWPAVRDGFDETLAVPPFDAEDVTGRFRERFVDTLRQHPGVAIVDVDADPPSVERDGLTDPPERAVARARAAADHNTPGGQATPTDAAIPADAAFPATAYESCLTADQGRALRAFERLREPGSAVVVESDRGRGKSSAAGLAAGSLAVEGRDVLVTAPAFRNAAEVFERARALVDTLGERAGEDDVGGEVTEDDRRIETRAGGVVRFASPAAATEMVAGDARVGRTDALADGTPDAVIVDEAAAIPVRLLTRLLDARSVAFCTTVHGYEGAGRGFSVRFKDRLAASDLAVTERRLEEPIRYARGDPVEGWAFRALMLDARPAVDAAVEDATPADAEYRTLDAEDLLADEHLLGEAFGLLVLAHYRTEPNDLARLLDAPNLSVRALLFEGRVVAVDLLAREGNLPEDLRASMYEGSRVRGNMIPDVLTSQLRDEDAGEPRGLRTMRIATHPALRDSGFGSRLLEAVHDEFAGELDYFGVGYGATPRLLRFWRRAGYRTVHVSTTRNDASGEYSAVMVRPESAAGEALLDRHAEALRDRLRDSLSDAHRDLDPDVARAALRACPASVAPDLDLSARDWRGVVGASYGPGMYDAAVGAFRDLAMAHLLDRGTPRESEGGRDREPARGVDLSPREERLLVAKVLQGHSWDTVADRLGYVSTGQCMRALGDAAKPLVDRYGDAVAHAERDRFSE